MSPRTHPDTPTSASDAERVVWERLRDQLPDDAVLSANRRFIDRDGECGADLIVALPDVGIAVLEVKGGHVSIDRDGVWRQRGGGADQAAGPVAPAQRCRYHLRDHLDADAG